MVILRSVGVFLMMTGAACMMMLPASAFVTPALRVFGGRTVHQVCGQRSGVLGMVQINDDGRHEVLLSKSIFTRRTMACKLYSRMANRLALTQNHGAQGIAEGEERVLSPETLEESFAASISTSQPAITTQHDANDGANNVTERKNAARSRKPPTPKLAKASSSPATSATEEQELAVAFSAFADSMLRIKGRVRFSTINAAFRHEFPTLASEEKLLNSTLGRRISTWYLEKTGTPLQRTSQSVLLNLSLINPSYTRSDLRSLRAAQTLFEPEMRKKFETLGLSFLSSSGVIPEGSAADSAAAAGGESKPAGKSPSQKRVQVIKNPAGTVIRVIRTADTDKGRKSKTLFDLSKTVRLRESNASATTPAAAAGTPSRRAPRAAAAATGTTTTFTVTPAGGAKTRTALKNTPAGGAVRLPGRRGSAGAAAGAADAAAAGAVVGSSRGSKLDELGQAIAICIESFANTMLLPAGNATFREVSAAFRQEFPLLRSQDRCPDPLLGKRLHDWYLSKYGVPTVRRKAKGSLSTSRRDIPYDNLGIRDIGATLGISAGGGGAAAAAGDAVDTVQLNRAKVALRKALQMEGVGMMVRRVGQDFTVFTIVPGSPAAQSGRIQIGDVLMAVDGRPARGLSTQELADLVLGPRGSLVRLTLRRSDVRGGGGVGGGGGAAMGEEEGVTEVVLKRNDLAVDAGEIANAENADRARRMMTTALER